MNKLHPKICPQCGSQVTVLIHEFQDGRVVKTFCHHCADDGLARLKDKTHCLRSDGTERAWFNSPEEAAMFRDAHPAYFGDVIVFCGRCGLFHCSNPNWDVKRPWETPVKNLKAN